MADGTQSADTTVEWRPYAKRAADAFGTPCYLISELGLRENLTRLAALEATVPLRHWLSMKSQPVDRLLQFALGAGLGVEVGSEFELHGALEAGVPERSILVDGTAKHRWLFRRPVRHLTVHFDSLAEVRELATLAKALDWRIGLRCAIPARMTSRGGTSWTQWDQFGMDREELRDATHILRTAQVPVRGLHFHLHKIPPRTTGDYRNAIDYVAEVQKSLGLDPEYLDIGGGLPVEGVYALDRTQHSDSFDMTDFTQMLQGIPALFPSVREVWMENGRFLSGSAGALVVTITDRKDRGDVTYLICDGGRVNHARMAASELHDILTLPLQTGPRRPTVVCGPTCAAVDRLGRWALPASVRPGDRIIWQNAGAYHIPLETRFSTGLAPVVWFEATGEMALIRERETASKWWNQWDVRNDLPLTASQRP